MRHFHSPEFGRFYKTLSQAASKASTCLNIFQLLESNPTDRPGRRTGKKYFKFKAINNYGLFHCIAAPEKACGG